MQSEKVLRKKRKLSNGSFFSEQPKLSYWSIVCWLSLWLYTIRFYLILFHRAFETQAWPLKWHWGTTSSFHESHCLFNRKESFYLVQGNILQLFTVQYRQYWWKKVKCQEHILYHLLRSSFCHRCYSTVMDGLVSSLIVFTTPYHPILVHQHDASKSKFLTHPFFSNSFMQWSQNECHEDERRA